MSFKTASQATLTFLSARKRIEGGLKNLGKKMSKHDVLKGEDAMNVSHFQIILVSEFLFYNQ